MLDKLITLFLVSAVLGISISYSVVYLFHISYAILCIYIIFNINKFNIKSLIKDNIRYILFFIIFFIWFLISFFWTIAPFIDYIKYNIYIFLGISIVFLLSFYIDSLEKFNKVFKILTIIFTLEIFLSLLEITPQFQLPISPSSSLVEYFGRSIASNNPTIPTGFNWNQNNLATVMVLLLPFALFYKKLFFKLFYSVLIGIVIYYTESRGAMLGYLIIIFIYLLTSKKFILTGLIFVFMMIVFTTINLKNPLQNQLFVLYDTVDKFIIDRKHATGAVLIRHRLIENGLNALQETNFLGVGAGGHIEVQKKLGGVYKNLNSLDYEYYKSRDQPIYSMHNFFMELLLNGGLFLFILFILWYLYIMKKLVNLFSNKMFSYFAKSLFLSMIAFSICSVVPSSMIYMFPVWILFGLCLALVKIGDKYENITII